LNTPKALIISQLPTTSFPAEVTVIIKDLGLQGETLHQWHAMLHVCFARAAGIAWL
jgi:hypothetical protein